MLTSAMQLGNGVEALCPPDVPRSEEVAMFNVMERMSTRALASSQT
jgi:hypothetical protein